MVEHVLRERSEAQVARPVAVAVGEVRVGTQPDAVSDAVCPVSQRVGDQFEVGRLAGVDRDVQQCRSGERQRLGMQGGREPGLGACKVESDHLVVPGPQPVDQPGDLDRAVLGAHGAQDRVHRDPAPGGSDVCLTAAEPGRDGVDHRLQREPSLLVQLRSEADLRVHHPVGGEIDDGLVGDPFDVLGGLHHRQGVLERRQVLQQVGGLCAAGEPRLQCVGVGLGECPADRVGQLHDRGDPQTAVEMIVQQHLGQAPGVVDGDRHVQGRARPIACP